MPILPGRDPFHNSITAVANNLFDHLTFRVRLSPTALALQSPWRQLNFRSLEFWAQRVAGKLRAEGVLPGQVAVLVLRNKDLHWIFTLALFHEATLACSVDRTPNAVPFAYDWLITDDQELAAPAAPVRVLRIDEAWMKAAVEGWQPVDPIAYPSDDTPARVFLTSGTTGRAKAVAMSTAQILARARSGVALRGTAPIICTLGHTTAADFNASVTALITGAPVFAIGNARQALDLVRERSIPGILSSPVQLASFINELIDSKQPLDCVKAVRTAGAGLPRRLLRAVRQHLTTNVVTMYSSTEAGGTCMFHPDEASDPTNAGFVQPDVTLQIVDDAGRLLPTGEVGQVRVRTPRMVQGYFRDEDQTAKSFRDGWFYPGDRGALTQDGRLLLAGREGELINSGGVKMDPAVLDRFLIDYPGVQDGAAFGVLDPAGIERLGAAVVVDRDFDIKALHGALAAQLPPTWKLAVLMNVRELPRNEMGKVLRSELRERAQISLSRSKTPR